MKTFIIILLLLILTSCEKNEILPPKQFTTEIKTNQIKKPKKKFNPLKRLKSKLKRNMGNNKQSSVEWLFEQIARRQGSILQTIPFYDDNQDLLQQAKAIHKEDIIETYKNAFTEGTYFGTSPSNYEYETSEMYYNKVFDSKNN